jgi:HK97 family phage prohead protease
MQKSQCEKAVPPVQDLPIEDGAWDGDAARQRLEAWARDGDDVDFPKYAKGFGYYDEDAADTFAAYKLPHHDVRDGQLVTSRRGVFAAMAALLGARGGVSLPEDERRAVYNHLADHYEQMGDEPPMYRAAYDDEGDEVKVLKAYSNRIDMKADEPRTVVARISTTAVDRDGDVVLPSGLKLQEYRKNPVVLLNHDNGSLPIGKALSVQRDRDTVVAKVQFAERPAEHPEGAEWVPDTILSLFKQKVLRAFSVGFMPLDMRDANEKDRKKFGDHVRRVITDWNLLEFSVVPVPANQDALAVQVAKSSSFLTEAWCLPAAKQTLVVPRRTLQLGDSAKTQAVRPLYRGPAESKNVRLPLTLKEGE